MKKLFSLFFIFFSYYTFLAQNTKQNEDIDKKLKRDYTAHQDKDGYISNICHKNALALGYLGLATASKLLLICREYKNNLSLRTMRIHYSTHGYLQMPSGKRRDLCPIILWNNSKISHIFPFHDLFKKKQCSPKKAPSI